jgi:hypothetical protein
MLHEGDSFRAAFFALRLLFKGSRLRLHQGKLVCFCAHAGTSYPQLTIEGHFPWNGAEGELVLAVKRIRMRSSDLSIQSCRTFPLWLLNADRRFFSVSSRNIPTGKFTQRGLSLCRRTSIDSGPHHVLPRAYCGCSSRWKMASSSDAWWVLAQNCTSYCPSSAIISCPSALQPKSPSQLLRAKFVCCNLCCGKAAIAN